MKWLLRVKRPDFAALPAEGADHAHAGEGLGGVAVDVLPLLADVAIQRPDARDPGAMRQKHHRQQHQRAEQQPPVDPGQHDQAAEQLDDRPPGIVEHAEDQLGDAAGVVAEEAGHAAALELVDAMQRQPHGMLEGLAARVDLHAGDGARGIPAAPQPDGGFDDRDHHHAAGQPPQQLQPAVGCGNERASRAAASGLPSSTLSIMSLVAAGGTSDNSVATVSVASEKTTAAAMPVEQPPEFDEQPPERTRLLRPQAAHRRVRSVCHAPPLREVAADSRRIVGGCDAWACRGSRRCPRGTIG